MKKKQKQVLAIVAIIAGIVLLAFFANKPFAISPGSIQSTDSQLIAEDSTSATYQFSFSSTGEVKAGSCNEVNQEEFEFKVIPVQSTSSLPKFVEGIKEEWTNATVTVSGIQATYDTCSDREKSAEIIFKELSGECRVKKDSLSGGMEKYHLTNWECIFRGKVLPYLDGKPTTARIYGLTGGNAVITVYKEGYEPIVANNPPIYNEPESFTPGQSNEQIGGIQDGGEIVEPNYDGLIGIIVIVGTFLVLIVFFIKYRKK